MFGKKEKWWEKRGLLIAGGWHPLNARIRNRIPEENIEEEYYWEYTEEHILRLKELGITILIGQFDRGLGVSDQKEHQELAKKVASLCHKHNIYHGVYMPNTVYYESVKKDHPECEDWVVKTAHGHKTYYGGEQTWRWVGCINSPGWRKRIKREINKAINYVKTDLLHFDNLGQSLAPHDCHCQYCQEKFRKFLTYKYPDAEAQKRRFGFTGFETFEIPVFFPDFGPPWSLDRIQSPLLQEWLLFRTEMVTDYIAEMSNYAHSLKPDIALDSNGQAFHGNNMGLVQGRGDSENQLSYVDILCEENPDLRPDDHPLAIDPVTRAFRGMNFGRTMGKPIFTSYQDEEELAFNMTFTGHPGINTRWGYAEPGKRALSDHQTGVKELLTHYLKNIDLYTKTRPAARIALWRNQMSLLFVSTDTHLSTCVMEYVLYKNRIPFSIVQDGFITDEKLADFDVVILPDVEFINEKQVKTLTKFVKNGGKLLITERSGICTGEPRLRNTPAFAHLFKGNLDSSSGELKENINIDENKQFSMQMSGGQAAYSNYGKGKVAYLPEINYVYPPRTFESKYNVYYDGIDSRYWKEPYNVEEILTSLEWLYPDLYPVKIFGFPNIRIDYLRLQDGSKTVPLFRFGEISGPVNVPVTLKLKNTPAKSSLIVPEKNKSVKIKWTQIDRGYETILPGIMRHAVLKYK